MGIFLLFVTVTKKCFKNGQGFDFLGYHFNGLALKPAVVTIERAIANITLLYEEKATPCGKRLADYARRLRSWLRAGVPLAPDVLNENSDIWSQLGVRDQLHVAKLIPTGVWLATQRSILLHLFFYILL